MPELKIMRGVEGGHYEIVILTWGRLKLYYSSCSGSRAWFRQTARPLHGNGFAVIFGPCREKKGGKAGVNPLHGLCGRIHARFKAGTMTPSA